MPAMPKYFMTLAAPLAGIFFENAIKNTAKLAERKIIPASAQILEGLCDPFTAFAPNRLLMKFFDQSKPMEFLSDKEPPGYTIVAINSSDIETIIPRRTEYFLSIWYINNRVWGKCPARNRGRCKIQILAYSSYSSPDQPGTKRTPTPD